MLPTLIETPPEGDSWSHEIKYDGYRTLVAVDGAATRAFTRNRHDWSKQYAPIVDAPKAYGPHKTLYNRFIRWSRLGGFDRIFASLAREGGQSERIMIDATHLKAHRTAASLLKKGMFPVVEAKLVRTWRPNERAHRENHVG
jgi:transposase